jgi:CsoR family transcriptional regulator, copper-sensing transcriptional repressor
MARQRSPQPVDNQPGSDHQTRPHHQRAAVSHRLARAAGHLESVRRMVDEGRDCPEILLQLAAVRAALDATAKVVLADHMESCVREAAQNGDADQAWVDLQQALETFIR